MADEMDQLLAALWVEIRSSDDGNLANLPAAARAVAAGAHPHDVALAMSAAAYEAVFDTLANRRHRGSFASLHARYAACPQQLGRTQHPRFFA